MTPSTSLVQGIKQYVLLCPSILIKRVETDELITLYVISFWDPLTDDGLLAIV